MIPEFPDFKKLELTDRKEVDEITRKFIPHSDYNFLGMWSWDVNSEKELSKLNGNLVAKLSNYDNGPLFYSFLGNERVPETASKIINHLKKAGLEQCLRLVHEEMVGLFDDSFEFIEDRNNFDYIYDLAGTIGYNGKTLKPKRHSVNVFLKKYQAEIVSLDLCDFNTQKEITRVVTGDEQGNQKYNPDEIRAIMRVVEHIKNTNDNLVSIGIRIKGNLVAFNITEIIQDYAIVHFEKGDFNNFPDMGAYIFQELMKVLQPKGVKLINLEQDMGIEGLRKNKMSYRPIKLLKKYMIACKN